MAHMHSIIHTPTRLYLLLSCTLRELVLYCRLGQTAVHASDSWTVPLSILVQSLLKHHPKENHTTHTLCSPVSQGQGQPSKLDKYLICTCCTTHWHTRGLSSMSEQEPSICHSMSASLYLKPVLEGRIN